MRKNGGTEMRGYTRREKKKREESDDVNEERETRVEKRRRNAQGNFLLYCLINGGR